MARLFTALEIPADIATQLSLLRGGVENAHWIEPESYHITLRYIGEIDDIQAQGVHEALLQIDHPAFTLRLAGIGTFGSKKPRSIWAKIRTNKALCALQQAHERACIKAGLEPEHRKFTPHITLTRLRKPKPAQVSVYQADHAGFKAGPFDVTRFVLFSSKPSRGGGPYIEERDYALNLLKREKR